MKLRNLTAFVAAAALVTALSIAPALAGDFYFGSEFAATNSSVNGGGGTSASHDGVATTSFSTWTSAFANGSPFGTTTSTNGALSGVSSAWGWASGSSGGSFNSDAFASFSFPPF